MLGKKKGEIVQLDPKDAALLSGEVVELYSPTKQFFKLLWRILKGFLVVVLSASAVYAVSIQTFYYYNPQGKYFIRLATFDGGTPQPGMQVAFQDQPVTWKDKYLVALGQKNPQVGLVLAGRYSNLQPCDLGVCVKDEKGRDFSVKIVPPDNLPSQTTNTALVMLEDKTIKSIPEDAFYGEKQ